MPALVFSFSSIFVDNEIKGTIAAPIIAGRIPLERILGKKIIKSSM